MSQENVERVLRGYEAFNRGDLEAASAGFDPNIEWVPLETLPDDAPVRGQEGVRRWWRMWREHMDDLRIARLGERHGVRMSLARRLLGSLTGALALALTATAPAPALAAPPNIVLVMTDDQALVDQSVMDKTNRLLGRQGTTFANAFATEPLCCPARATLLTGQYSHNHGVLSNRAPLGSLEAFGGREQTLAPWLAAAGYRTGIVGKYLNGIPPLHPDPGWETWVVPHGAEFEPAQMYDYDLSVNGVERHFGSRASDYKTDVLTRYALDFVRAQDARPFALLLWDVAPHKDERLPPGHDNPEPAPRHRGAFRDERFATSPAFDERAVDDKASWNRVGRIGPARERQLTRRRSDRLASLLAVDEQVAALVEALRDRGELGNTLFVFTSDNGFLYGEHRLSGKSRPYEESIRVPLLIRGPGFRAGAVRRDLVAHHDLTATIAAAAGARPDRVLDGIDLRSRERRSRLLLECLACVPINERAAGWRLLHTGRTVQVEYRDGQFESYDLRRDRHQLDGGRDPHSTRSRALLDAAASCVGEACP